MEAIQKLFGAIITLAFLMFLLSFLLQFSGLINLVLSVLIFFVAFISVFFFTGNETPDHISLSLMAMTFCIFGFVWSASPILLSTSDFCAYQLETSTQYYSRASTPKEWFSSGNLNQIESRTLSRSLTAECEEDVVDFMINEQPTLIWVRATIFGLSLLGFMACIKSMMTRRPKKNKARQKKSKTQKKEALPTAYLINRVIEIEAGKQYRDSRSLIQEVEACLKAVSNRDIPSDDRESLMAAISKIVDDLPNCYSEKEINGGMLKRKIAKFEKALSTLRND